MYTKVSLFLSVSLCILGGSASAQDWAADLDFGALVSDRQSTDTDIVGSPFIGGYVGGYASGNIGMFSVAIDGRYELTGDEGLNDVYLTGPLHSGVLGLHFGANFGPVYAGVFAAKGFVDGYDSEKPMNGTVQGIELAYAVSPTINVMAQLGAAKAIGSDGDNEYDGYAAKIAVDAKISDTLGLSFALENGRSEDCFVDCGDQPGEYFGVSFGANYALNDKITLVGSINSLRIEDYDDPDTGKDLTLYLGARYTLGDVPTPTRRLTTPISVFKAAGWMSPLD